MEKLKAMCWKIKRPWHSVAMTTKVGTKIMLCGMAMPPDPGEHIQKKGQILHIECPTQGMGG